MKKLLSVLVLMFACVGQVFAYDFVVNGIYYNKSGSNATVTYETTSYNSYSGSVVIPSTVTYGGVTYSVTSIGSKAFYKCSGLTSITIPSSVTSIGSSAFFNCSGLTSVTIGNGVESIGEYAFYNCSSLTSVTIPSSVTSIGHRSFYNCAGLTSITIPNSVTSIESGAFEGCSGLTSVTIPSSVTSIGSSAFWSCRGLTSVTIPSSVTYIEPNTFNNCSGLTSVSIPSSVTGIGESAFENCDGLTSVTVPNSVTSIASCAFFSCSGLNSVTIPSSVTYIGSNAFGGCNNVKELIYAEGCTTTLRTYLLRMTSVTIPSSVKSISNSAFESCEDLTSVVIPNSVTSIGNYAFQNCKNLTEVTIGNSVNTIGTSAFKGCSSLQNITNLATEPQIVNANTFSAYTANLYVRKGCIEAYSETDVWKNFANIQELTVAISDGGAYIATDAITNAEVTYARTFNNTNWQALYVPFSMKYDDWKDYMDVYDIYNVLAYDEDNNGEIERTTVNMIRLKEGAVTEPNYPYVVRAKNAGDVEITLTDATLYAAEENSIDCTSTKQKFTFTGIYNSMTGLATKGCYALDGGVLKTAIDDAVTLKPQRWYMEVTNRDGSPAAATRVYLNPFGEENEAEGVKGVAVNVIGEETTYDLNGRTVNAAQLPKGLYVRGGKKIIVK